MGNAQHSHLRSIFDKIDKNKSGFINLQEILENNSDDHNTPVICSLMSLYHFDLTKEGTLTYKEFFEMEKFIEKIQKRVEKKNRKKKIRSSLSSRTGSEDDMYSLDKQKYSCLSTKYNIKDEETSEQDQSTATDLHTNGVKSNTNGDSDGEGTSTNGCVFSKMSKKDLEEVLKNEETKKINDEVKKEMTIALLPSITKTLYNTEGRLLFLDWLFKLSDVHKKGQISQTELNVILKAVQDDDINLESLLFDSTEDLPTEKTKRNQVVVKRLMNDYDSTSSNVLNKRDFMKLGDLILSKYEARNNAEMSSEEIGSYKMLQELGKGGYGIVRYAEGPNAKKRAIKIVKRGNVSDMSKLDNEIQAMQLLRHPHVVRLYEVLEDESNIYLVIELCGGGSLYEYLKEEPFDEELARHFFSKLVDGLEYCHKMGVCHRDLRLENLLLDNNGNLKITDFGQARIFEKGWDLFSTQLVGSLYHFSPEQIDGKVYSGEKLDIWSAGIILYCFLTARLPFCSPNVNQMFNDIRTASYTYPEDCKISDEAKELISMMINTDPDKRESLANIKKSSWLQGKKKEPQLMIHKFNINLKLDEDRVEIIRDKFIDILKSNNIYVKYFKDRHKGVVCGIATDSVLDSNDDSMKLLRSEDITSTTTIKTVPLQESEHFRPLSEIFKTPLVVNKKNTDLLFKCIHPLKNFKFNTLIAILPDTVCFEFQLFEGETKEYNEFLKRLDKDIKKELDSL